MRDSFVEELCYSDVVVGLSEELCHGDVVAVLAIEELCYSNVVASLVQELSHRDVVCLKELGDGGVKVVGEVKSVLFMVGGDHFVEELGHGDIIAVQVLCHCAGVGAIQELGHSDVVRIEELRDDVVKELGNRDIVLIEEGGKCAVGRGIHELCDRDVSIFSSKEFSDRSVFEELGHGDVAVLGDGIHGYDCGDVTVLIMEELRHRNVSVVFSKELGHSDIVASLVEELCDRDVSVVIVKELGHRNVPVVVIFKELGHGDVSIVLIEELCY